MTTIYHTSPEEITEIKENRGPFGGALFFSVDEYAMNNVKCTYTLELNNDDVIHVNSLDDDEIVSEIVELADRYLDMSIDEDFASDLLTAHEIIWDNLEDDFDGEWVAEFDWTLQGLQAKAAKKAGYLAVESEDEQGTVYIINMINKEHLLQLVK